MESIEKFRSSIEKEKYSSLLYLFMAPLSCKTLEKKRYAHHVPVDIFNAKTADVYNQVGDVTGIQTAAQMIPQTKMLVICVVNARAIGANVGDVFHNDGCVMEFRTALIALTRSNVKEKTTVTLIQIITSGVQKVEGA
ncbi:uncharacterized protein LOC127722177 isoform X2 [Mytilus californianus]|uniref:uncharacterized protein LOC127722177 isoform X2 n=1 Tax=Mytilus californianus TaxID=6549 RepID=UPI00224503B4|nr:uncharacterized protein LOC127722177 isoform X2 [Mytilus californianus]